MSKTGICNSEAEAKKNSCESPLKTFHLCPSSISIFIYIRACLYTLIRIMKIKPKRQRVEGKCRGGGKKKNVITRDLCERMVWWWGKERAESWGY